MQSLSTPGEAGGYDNLERAKVAALVSIAASLAILADNAVGQAPPSSD